MNLGMVGLGKMGGNMARRLLAAGHRVVGFNLHHQQTDQLAQSVGLTPAYSLEELVSALPSPRAIWVMVPAGAPTEEVLLQLAELCAPGDMLIDGGNSNFRDSMRRGQILQERGLQFLDVGVSGGIWGLAEGYALMIGGSQAEVQRLAPIFAALAPAPDQGWGWVGPNGAGHYVKMVHNGIEYGMMEAFAEGFDLLNSHPDFNMDLSEVARIWQNGSVVRSWLLDLIAEVLAEDADLSGIAGWVADSGEGRWTLMEAVHLGVPVPVIAQSLFRRFESRDEDRYAAKLLAAMRQQFGGHSVKPSDE